MVVVPAINRRPRRRPHVPATARDRVRDVAALLGCLFLCAVALMGAFAARRIVASAVVVERGDPIEEEEEPVVVEGEPTQEGFALQGVP